MHFKTHQVQLQMDHSFYLNLQVQVQVYERTFLNFEQVRTSKSIFYFIHRTDRNKVWV